MLVRWWEETEEQIREAHPHESLKNREELINKVLHQKIQEKAKRKSIKIADSQISKWYQKELLRLRKESPEKPLKELKSDATKEVSKKIKELQKEPQRPSDKKIAEWLREILVQLREEYPHKPLSEREQVATEKLERKIKQYQSVLPLDNFFNIIEVVKDGNSP